MRDRIGRAGTRLNSTRWRFAFSGFHSHAIVSRVTDVPQFSTAEYPAGPGTDVCKVCRQPIVGTYYRANRAMLCPGCTERVRQQIPQDNHPAFVRGIAFGVGGFFIGLTLYAGFVIATGIEIGFVSLAVGWLVGKAIMMGSRGIGGRRYQIAAVLLTYAAVSMAFVPIVIHYARTQPLQQAPTQQSGTSSPNNQTGQPQAAPSHNPAKEGRSRRIATALGKLALIGLASPFLQLQGGISGVIGLFILFIGMQFAWRITAGVRISLDGPYENSPPLKA